MNDELKRSVKQHWESEVCGSRYAFNGDTMSSMEVARYRLEPEILDFAQFPLYEGRKVLEIGVGAGVDHLSWHRAGADVYGVDLTMAAVNLTSERLRAGGFSIGSERLRQADAEDLPFPDNVFDLVYSWGVLHHTPDTQRAFAEAHRVCKPGGEVRVMIYHHPSWTALMLYAIHGLLKLRPAYSLRQVVYDHLESPGTKTYTATEARKMLTAVGFEALHVWSGLSAGDKLDIKLSKRYQSAAARLIYRVYPRWLVRLCGHRLGLNLFIHGYKGLSSPDVALAPS